MPRPIRDRSRGGNSPNLEKAADRGSLGSKTSPRRPDLSKPEIQRGGLGLSVSREYNDAFPGITNKETASIGIDSLFSKNKLSGEINPQNKSGKIDIGIGNKALGGNLGIAIDFRDGWIPNIAIDFGAKIAGIGGNIGINTRGGGKIGIGLGAGSIEVAVDKQGNKTATFCYGVPGLEICNEYSRTKKDPQLTPINPRPVTPKVIPTKPVKPKKPKLLITKKRTKPKPKPKKPQPKPIKPPKKPTPIKPKRPLPLPLPVPIPKPVKPPKPTPSPKLPRPAPTPKPTPPAKLKRPNPWPRPGNPPTTPQPITKIECSNGTDIELLFDRMFSDTGSGMTRLSEHLNEQLLRFQQTYTNPSGYNAGQLQDPQAEDIKQANLRWGAGVWVFEQLKFTSYLATAERGDDDPYKDFIRSGYWYRAGVKIGDRPVTLIKFTLDKKRYYHPAYPPTYFPINGFPYNYKVELIDILPAPSCPPGSTPVVPPQPTPPKYNSPRLPNKPTKIKPMDCCKDIKDLIKYLGITKLKKNKFKVAKAFMVPGGTGNEECEDFYTITQALFRMLANGLIINPVSKPLGNEWKSVNATAWAGSMYEMMAESMSDGNSSQRYEMASIMHLTQMLSILAELTRKVEFAIDVLGSEPEPEIEYIPSVFTIYESHKGFEKKEPKKIDIGKAKTDDQVEAILTKMMVPSLIPIVRWKFNPEHISIMEALRGEKF